MFIWKEQIQTKNILGIFSVTNPVIFSYANNDMVIHVYF